MTCRPKIIGDFIIEEEIGRGSFATVYKGFNRTTGLNVAVKVINKDKLNKKLILNLDTEIYLLRNCCHENVVRLLDAKKTENHIYLIMEYCAGGDFSKWFRRRKIISEADAKFYLGQVAKGLFFMHERGLLHRDLKPQNFLMTEWGKSRCCLKIGDFGFAKHLSGAADLAATVCGSPLYMAPEILMWERYDAKADLWSIGVILYEMLWGRPPFRAENHIELARKFTQKPQVKFPAFIQIIEKARNDKSAVLRAQSFQLKFHQTVKTYWSGCWSSIRKKEFLLKIFFRIHFSTNHQCIIYLSVLISQLLLFIRCCRHIQLKQEITKKMKIWDFIHFNELKMMLNLHIF